MIGGGDQVVDQKFVDSGTWEIDIAGTKHAALASIRPLFDPENKKVKA